MDEDDVQLNLAPGGDEDEAEVAAEDGGAGDDEQADEPLPAAWQQGEELAAERHLEEEQPAAEPPASGLLEPRWESGEVDEVEEEDELAQLAALDRQCADVRRAEHEWAVAQSAPQPERAAAVHRLPGRKTVRLLRSLTRFWHLWLDKYPQEIAPTGPNKVGPGA